MVGAHRDTRQRLTPRERQICEALAKCCTNREIAAQLGISPSTVRNRVHVILKKLHLRRRGEVIARYSRLPPPGNMERHQLKN